MRELNPDFALQSRLSFGRGARYAWLLSAAAVLLTLEEGVTGGAPGVTSMRAGALLLLGALPYGAIHVRALERKGQMETRRLTAGSPARLALALIAGSSWALVLSGALLLAAGAAAGHPLAPLTLAAIVALSIAMTLVLLLLPASYQLDSWVLLLLLGVAVFQIVESMRGDRSVAIGLLIVSLAIVPWALPMALRRMRAPIPKSAGAPVSIMRLVVRLGATTHAELARGLVSAGQSFSAAPAVAIGGTWLIWWLTRNVHPTARDIFEVLFVYGPLVLAAYDTASRVAHEHSTGGLDRIRLTGQSAWRVVIEIALAFSMPFVGVSLVCATAVALFDPANRRLLGGWPIAAVVLVLVPMIGALQGKKPGVFIAIAILLAIGLGTADVDRGVGVVAVATVIGLAAASMDRGLRQRLEPGAAAAGAAGLAAVVAGIVHTSVGGPVVAAILALTAGLLFPGRARIAPRTIALCAGAAALTAAVADVVWGNGRFGVGVRVFQTSFGTVYMPARGSRVAYSWLIAMNAGIGLAFGCYALNQVRGRTFGGLALRAAPAAVSAAILIGSHRFRVYEERFMERVGYSGAAIFDLLFLMALAFATLFLAWRDSRSIRGTPPPS